MPADNTQSIARIMFADVREAVVSPDDTLHVDATAQPRVSVLRFEETHDVCVVRASEVRSTPSTTVYMY